jgi:Domain of unknown function (DUF6371)
MSQNHRYILQPYKSLSDRYTCPSCNEKKKFTRYIDRENNEYLGDHVGRCERSDSCGYHYTPKDYFRENPDQVKHNDKAVYITPLPLPKREPSFIEKATFEKTLKKYDTNNFTIFLESVFGFDVAKSIIDKYKIGTTSHGGTVFYQVDLQGKIRSGKIIKYNIIESLNTFNSKDCKRDKTLMPSWVHKALKLEDFNLTQCLFGEHLLTDKSKPVAVVESEKSAVIASIYLPQYTWLSCGGKEGLGTSKIQVLRNREVILFPDLGGYEKWNVKADEIRIIAKSVKVSNILEVIATDAERVSGLDLADYLLRSPPPSQREPERIEIENPIEPNPLNPHFDRVVNVLQWFGKCSYLFDGTVVLFSGEVVHDCLSHIKDLHFQIQDYQTERELIQAVERLESIKAIMTDKPLQIKSIKK